MKIFTILIKNTNYNNVTVWWKVWNILVLGILFFVKLNFLFCATSITTKIWANIHPLALCVRTPTFFHFSTEITGSLGEPLTKDKWPPKASKVHGGQIDTIILQGLPSSVLVREREKWPLTPTMLHLLKKCYSKIVTKSLLFSLPYTYNPLGRLPGVQNLGHTEKNEV